MSECIDIFELAILRLLAIIGIFVESNRVIGKFRRKEGIHNSEMKNNNHSIDD